MTRKNKPEVIDRANKTRAQRMKDEGRVYAYAKVECWPEHRDEIRAAGLAAMNLVKNKLEK